MCKKCVQASYPGQTLLWKELETSVPIFDICPKLLTDRENADFEAAIEKIYGKGWLLFVIDLKLFAVYQVT